MKILHRVVAGLWLDRACKNIAGKPEHLSFVAHSYARLIDAMKMAEDLVIFGHFIFHAALPSLDDSSAQRQLAVLLTDMQ
jgi:hypothetical protein